MQSLDTIERQHGILWRFDTAHYTIAFWAEDEDLAPEDSFCDERDIAYAREDDPERAARDAWIAREGCGLPVSCEDAGFLWHHDAFREMPFGADCQDYIFLI